MIASEEEDAHVDVENDDGRQKTDRGEERAVARGEDAIDQTGGARAETTLARRTAFDLVPTEQRQETDENGDQPETGDPEQTAPTGDDLLVGVGLEDVDVLVDGDGEENGDGHQHAGHDEGVGDQTDVVIVSDAVQASEEKRVVVDHGVFNENVHQARIEEGAAAEEISDGQVQEEDVRQQRTQFQRTDDGQGDNAVQDDHQERQDNAENEENELATSLGRVLLAFVVIHRLHVPTKETVQRITARVIERAVQGRGGENLALGNGEQMTDARVEEQEGVGVRVSLLQRDQLVVFDEIQRTVIHQGDLSALTRRMRCSSERNSLERRK